ncbi:LamG-like jellyroll fold domain-containing protein, partial [Planctomycetota bacterium]
MSKSLPILIVCLGLLIPAGTVWGQQLGLVGHWPLDEAIGSTTADVSGNGHNGTLEGEPQWVSGVYGGALDFHAGNDHVNVTHTPRMDMEDQLTIAAWINARNYSERLGTGLVMRSSSYVPYGMQIFEDGAVRFVANQLFQGSIGGGEWNSRTKISLNEWTHAAVTYDGLKINFYINGERDERVAVTEIIFQESDVSLWIGRDDIRDASFDGMIDDVWIYDRSLMQDEIRRVMVGGSFDYSSRPRPAQDANDVERDRILSWAPGESAHTHNVYLGTSWEDVNDATVGNPLGVLVSAGQDANFYIPDALLDYGQTYHWRVDEVNAPPDSTVFVGDVWTFETEPFAYPVENILATASSSQGGSGPENTVNGSGLNMDDEHGTLATDMWLSQVGGTQPSWIQYDLGREYKLDSMLVWNSNQGLEDLFGVGIREASIELSVDGENWTLFSDVEFAQGTGEANYAANTSVDLQGVTASYVRITAKSNWKNFVPQFSLSEVRILYLPLQARTPQPADGAADVDPGIASLTWRGGREAAQSQVIFSDDIATVEDNSALVGTVAESLIDATDLNIQLGTQYFWRVNEVNEAEVPTTWFGDIWSFSTSDFLIVDDMEPYANSPGLELWATWVDGYDVPGNGALVGNGNDG